MPATIKTHANREGKQLMDQKDRKDLRELAKSMQKSRPEWNAIPLIVLAYQLKQSFKYTSKHIIDFLTNKIDQSEKVELDKLKEDNVVFKENVQTIERIMKNNNLNSYEEYDKFIVGTMPPFLRNMIE